MKIWVDADACPKVIKEILFRAAKRTKIRCTLVANHPMMVPPSPFIKRVCVEHGFDVADNYIVQQLLEGDLVITADIPLAAEVIAKGGYALNPRGTFYDEQNIAERLRVRNMMEELRSTGEVSGGPPPLNQADRQAFANHLDRFLNQHG
jgi:uncharacterized protein YaiI (UPF0178 family)